eukprot:364496-Chlamydomonas_euryale.AAC.64
MRLRLTAGSDVSCTPRMSRSSARRCWGCRSGADAATERRPAAPPSRSWLLLQLLQLRPRRDADGCHRNALPPAWPAVCLRVARLRCRVRLAAADEVAWRMGEESASARDSHTHPPASRCAHTCCH